MKRLGSFGPTLAAFAVLGFVWLSHASLKHAAEKQAGYDRSPFSVLDKLKPKPMTAAEKVAAIEGLFHISEVERLDAQELFTGARQK